MRLLSCTCSSCEIKSQGLRLSSCTTCMYACMTTLTCYVTSTYVCAYTGVPLDVLATEVGVDGGDVDAGVFCGFLLDLGNHWGCLRDVVGSTHLHVRREDGAIPTHSL